MLTLIVGVLSGLLDVLLPSFFELWAIPPDELDHFVPPTFLSQITYPSSYVQHSLMMLHHDIAKLYGRLWFHSGLFALLGNPIIHAFNFVFGFPRWLLELIEGLATPARFLLLTFVYNQVAILLGGKGQLGRFAFLVAAVGATLAAINAVIDFLPLIAGVGLSILPESSPMLSQQWYYLLRGFGFPASLVTTAYWFFLFYFPMKIEHGLSWWRAIIGVALSYFLFFILEAFVPHGVPSGLMEAARLMREGG